MQVRLNDQAQIDRAIAFCESLRMRGELSAFDCARAVAQCRRRVWLLAARRSPSRGSSRWHGIERRAEAIPSPASQQDAACVPDNVSARMQTGACEVLPSHPPVQGNAGSSSISNEAAQRSIEKSAA